ncbi:hypothetical protein RJT34_23120 [Clitoria ternatea]|uniref:mannan endo-1,4-beta-mannosidase n=1 Tax=Clitoria ternatea TaxID=43366 RepID=A0AAN9II39_CLITE
MGFQNLVLTTFTVALVVSQQGKCNHHQYHKETVYNGDSGFVQRNGKHFILEGKPYYMNGFNAYWLMLMASDPSTISNVTYAFKLASQHGLTVARTNAFNDGTYRPLQISPGSYDESVFRAWVNEMATYLKSIDRNHLLEIGLEGFYGESTPEKKQFNPGYQIGTDFITNNQVPQIDFATIHLYPDRWLPGSSNTAQNVFADRWVQAHIQDSSDILRKPILLTEFGKSSRSSGYSVGERDYFFGKMYNEIYKSSSSGGPYAGGFFWQLLTQGMVGFGDGYEIIFEKSPSTVNVITQQSNKMSNLK